MRSFYAFLLLFFSLCLHAQSDLVITAMYDGPLTGGTPKGIELYATADIADLSIYGLGIANNGGGSDGEEYNFPADNITAGTYIYWTLEFDGFAIFFGPNPQYLSELANINGDDPIELYKDGVVVDVFGDVALDGTGELWEHLDGWAYRVPGTGPDGANFQLANWTFSGINSFDDAMTNATSVNPMPIGTYGEPIMPDQTVNIVGLGFQPKDITIELGQTVRWTNTTGVGHNVNGSIDDYAMNPEGFFSGAPSSADWEFDHKFTKAGAYGYRCDPHFGAGMTGTVTVNGVAPVTANDNVQLMVNGTASTNVLNNDFLQGSISSFSITEMPGLGQAMVMGDSTINYSPSQDVCGTDSLTYEICTGVNLCATAKVYYDISCPVNYPAYPISLVTTLNSEGIPDSLETECAVTGIVYGINFRPEGLQFTIIDKADADAGMGIFLDSGNLGYTVTEGDEITVQGEITFFNGLTQMRPDEIQLISQGNTLFTPEAVTALGEETESKLIVLEIVTFGDLTEWDAMGSGFTVTVSDGNTDFDVRIDADTDIFNSDPPFGGSYRITGIGGQFDGDSPHDSNYQILPRTLSDISFLSNTSDLVDPEFLIFPNPATNELSINTGLNWEKLELYDMQGRKIVSKAISGNTHLLNTSQLSNGQYWIKLINSEGVQSKSFQKY